MHYICVKLFEIVNKKSPKKRAGNLPFL